MEKLKLNLEDLKVESFELNSEEKKQGTVNGQGLCTEDFSGCRDVTAYASCVTCGTTCGVNVTCQDTCANTCENTCAYTCLDPTCHMSCPTCPPSTNDEINCP